MGTMKGQVLSSATKLLDLVLLIGSFAAAVLPHVRASRTISLAQFLGLKIKLGDIVIFSSLLGGWILIFTMLGLYGSKRLASRRSEAFDVIKATSLCAAVLALASFLLDFQWVTPGFVAIFWLC